MLCCLAWHGLLDGEEGELLKPERAMLDVEGGGGGGARRLIMMMMMEERSKMGQPARIPARQGQQRLPAGGDSGSTHNGVAAN